MIKFDECVGYEEITTEIESVVAPVPEFTFSTYGIKSESRPGAYITSFVGQSVLVALMMTLSFTAPKVIEKLSSHVTLIAPRFENAIKLAPAPAPRISEPKVFAPRTEPLLVMSSPVRPRIQSVPVPVAPSPKLTLQTKSIPVPNTPTALPPRPVLVGTFGQPDGATPNPNANSARRPTLAAAGSFETQVQGTPSKQRGMGTVGGFDPQGAGPSGHGTAKTLATGGFNTVSGGTSNGNGTGPVKRVVAAAFNTTPAAAQSPVQMAPKETPITSVAIQSKPAPVYTEEAKRLHIQGDVILEVVFASNGHVKVKGVVKGLGHGLDEAAISAAKQISFTPARKDGQVIDYTATIHVVFALS